MWVQELFIDEFDGGGDLSLHQLSPTLNVIRVPSVAAAASLARFIPTLLYGQSSPNSPAQAGSLVVTQQTEAGAWEVLDLCRLPLEGAAELSELQVLAERGQVVDEDRLLERLEAIDGPVYRAVFTDDLSYDERLASWQSADWIVPLLRRPERSVPAGESTPEDHPERIRRKAATTARQRAVVRWIGQREKMAATPPVCPAGEPWEGSPASRRSSNRDTYLRAKQAADAQRRQIGELRQQQTQTKRTIELLARAAELAPQWDRLKMLQAEASPPAVVPVAAEDIRELRQLGPQLASLRRRLRQLQDQGAAALHQQAVTPLRQRQQQLNLLLNDWPACREQCQRVAHLRVQLADQQRQLQDERRRQTSIAVRNAVAEVHHSARAVRAARQQFRQAADATDGLPVQAHEMPCEAPPSAALDPQIASLRRQIRQLREETRRLLQRQLLSRRALLGIGLLFAAGVAIVLSAATLHLDGAELATGAIGLTCIVSAALLKSSFERTPTYQLRRQRLRITALLEELQRLQTGDESDLAAEGPAATVAAAAASGNGISPGLIAAQQQLAQAQRDWFQILNQLDLAEDLTAREAVRALRARVQTAEDETAETALDWLRDELSRHQSSVDDWCREAARVLQDPTLATDDVTPEEGFRRIQAEQERLAAEIDALEDQATSRAERSRLRHEFRQKQRRWREILDRHGAQRLDDLEQRLQRQVERAALDAERQRLEATFQALSREPQSARIVQWLEEGLDVEQQRDHQLQTVDQIQRELHAAQQALVEHEAEIVRLSARPWPSAAEAAAEGPMSTGGHDALAIDLAGAILAALDAAEPAAPPARPLSSGPPRWLQLASQFLQQLGDEGLRSLDWEDAATGPYVIQADGSRTAPCELTSEQRHMLVLALQLALVRCLSERIGHLPLVLSDRSFRIAPEIAARLSELLCDVAKTGQQILVITVEAAVRDLFRSLDVPTLVVTRQAHAAAALPEANERVPPHVSEPVGNRRPADTEFPPIPPESSPDDRGADGPRHSMAAGIIEADRAERNRSPVELHWETDEYRPPKTDRET